MPPRASAKEKPSHSLRFRAQGISSGFRSGRQESGLCPVLSSQGSDSGGVSRFALCFLHTAAFTCERSALLSARRSGSPEAEGIVRMPPFPRRDPPGAPFGTGGSSVRRSSAGVKPDWIYCTLKLIDDRLRPVGWKPPSLGPPGCSDAPVRPPAAGPSLCGCGKMPRPALLCSEEPPGRAAAVQPRAPPAQSIRLGKGGERKRIRSSAVGEPRAAKPRIA